MKNKVDWKFILLLLGIVAIQTFLLYGTIESSLEGYVWETRLWGGLSLLLGFLGMIVYVVKPKESKR